MTTTTVIRPFLAARSVFAAGLMAAAGLASVALMSDPASAEGPSTRPSCDTDRDGKSDAWGITNRNGELVGIAVDIGQGHILVYNAKNLGLYQTGPTTCLMWLDYNGDGRQDANELYDLCDKNGDGDFGDEGELMQRGETPPRRR
jgi:hypothetical protein